MESLEAALPYLVTQLDDEIINNLNLAVNRLIRNAIKRSYGLSLIEASGLAEGIGKMMRILATSEDPRVINIIIRFMKDIVNLKEGEAIIIDPLTTEAMRVVIKWRNLDNKLALKRLNENTGELWPLLNERRLSILF